MWDFGGRGPIGGKAMADQLAFALEKLHSGERQGVMFHNAALVYKDIVEVWMARRWIAEHGGERVGIGHEAAGECGTSRRRLTAWSGKSPNGKTCAMLGCPVKAFHRRNKGSLSAPVDIRRCI